jgi:TetR/AcrR family transcriptional repressor of lmrAB and yxaGH operons
MSVVIVDSNYDDRQSQGVGTRSVRDEMIRGAATLLSRRGLQATSFSEVLAHTGAPRGSVYHHFPGGKSEMVTEALRLVGANVVQSLRHRAGEPAAAVVAEFGRSWRQLLIGTDLIAGCSIAAVTIGAADAAPDLVAVAGGVFTEWRAELASLLTLGGVPEPRSAALAATVLAALEGAMILSRAERDIAVFDGVLDELVALTTAAQRDEPGQSSASA